MFVGVVLGVLVSVACHNDGLVQHDILEHLIQHFTDGAEIGFVLGVKDTHPEAWFT